MHLTVKSTTTKINWGETKTQPNAKHYINTHSQSHSNTPTQLSAMHPMHPMHWHMQYPLSTLSQFTIHIRIFWVIRNLLNNNPVPSRIIYLRNAFERRSGFPSISYYFYYYYYYYWGSMAFCVIRWFRLDHIFFLTTNLFHVHLKSQREITSRKNNFSFTQFSINDRYIEFRLWFHINRHAIQNC